MNRKYLLVFQVILALSFTGCTSSLYSDYMNSSVNNSITSSIEQEMDVHNRKFEEVFKSDLKSWIGKDTVDLKETFPFGASDAVLDVNGNGWMSYSKNYLAEGYVPSRRLVFYLEKYVIYNVVRFY